MTHLNEFLRIIGDVHAQIDFSLRDKPTYLDLISECSYSVQVGDMGDRESYDELNSHVDCCRHRFVAGNHDDYDHLPPHALGDFGLVELAGMSFFFVRGASSSDLKKRLEQQKKLGRKLWWEEEELSESVLEQAIDSYAAATPSLVISHTAPSRIARFVKGDIFRESQQSVNPEHTDTRTNRYLERMLDTHRPNLWCFGHFHRDWKYIEDGTEFRCIGELSYFDLFLKQLD